MKNLTLLTRPIVQTSEDIVIGTLDGRQLAITREFDGTFVAILGQHDYIELTEAEYNEIRALALQA